MYIIKFIQLIIIIIILLNISLGFLMSDIPQKEREALIAFYNSTNGDNWTDNYGWKTSTLYSDGFSMPGTEGNWSGVILSNDHVVRLMMNKNNLSGTLPAQIGNLSRLTELRLDQNRLTGEIPESIKSLKINVMNSTTTEDTGDLEISYNCLSTTNSNLKKWLDKRDFDWEITQCGHPYKPVISVKRKSLYFEVKTNNVNSTPPQHVIIKNEGKGPLAWSVKSDNALISVEPTHGTGNGTIKVQVIFNKMIPQEGTHNGNIIINAPYAENSPLIIPVVAKIGS